jgi:hypothetical protein
MIALNSNLPKIHNYIFSISDATKNSDIVDSM